MGSNMGKDRIRFQTVTATEGSIKRENLTDMEFINGLTVQTTRATLCKGSNMERVIGKRVLLKHQECQLMNTLENTSLTKRMGKVSSDGHQETFIKVNTKKMKGMVMEK